MNASSLIIATGKPVMALGGFSGSDKILTTQQLDALVKQGTVRYFLLQSGGGPGFAPSASMLKDLPASARAQIEQRGAGGPGGGPDGGNSALTQWVSKSCTAVPSSAYQAASTTATSGASGAAVGGGMGATLYDCGSLATGSR